MKKMIWIALMLAFNSYSHAYEELESAISDVAVMSAREDGKYTVFCANGNKEIVSDLDISLNNVCPNRTQSEPTNILSLQKRADGNFDVVCKDLKKLIVTQADLLAGKACVIAKPKVKIEDGVYKVTSGYSSFYDQTITATHQGDSLTKLNVKAASSGWTCDMNCTDLKCQGTGSNSTCTSSKVEVLGSTKYKFNDSREAIFEKIK